MEKITITIASRGPEGNIYSILGKVRSEMRRRRLIEKYNNLYTDVTISNSYKEAIARPVTFDFNICNVAYPFFIRLTQ